MKKLVLRLPIARSMSSMHENSEFVEQPPVETVDRKDTVSAQIVAAIQDAISKIGTALVSTGSGTLVYYFVSAEQYQHGECPNLVKSDDVVELEEVAETALSALIIANTSGHEDLSTCSMLWSIHTANGKIQISWNWTNHGHKKASSDEDCAKALLKLNQFVLAYQQFVVNKLHPQNITRHSSIN